MNVGHKGYSISILVLTAGMGFTLAVLSAAAAPGGSILYAAPSQTGNGSCLSWANACTLQAALAVSGEGDQIWARMGVYKPTDTSDQNISFNFKNGVAVYGGFDGTETALSQRDPDANLTILSGDIDNDDITDPNGVVTDTVQLRGFNSFSVVKGSDVDETTVLDGITITAGRNWESSSNFDGGGGIRIVRSSPTLANLTIIGNSAEGLQNFGGGIYNKGGSPTLTKVIIRSNWVYGFGGGMYNDDGNPRLTHVTFQENSGIFGGGGMSNSYSNPTLIDVTFIRHSCAGNGCGMANYYSNPTLTNVTFFENDGEGMSNLGSNPRLNNVAFIGNTSWGMYNNGSNPFLEHVTFSGNSNGMFNHASSPVLTDIVFSGNTTSYSDGGGMWNLNGSNPVLTNVLFSGNSALKGGGIYNENGSPTLTNVTFSGNSAESGGAFYNHSGHPTLTNVIVWGNTAITGTEIYVYSGSPTISYSDIQGSGGSGAGWDPGMGTDGGGNIDADPNFVQVVCAGLHLGPGSPAIDAGNNNAVYGINDIDTVFTDLDGKPRFVDISSIPDTGYGMPPLVDLGAYEAQTVEPSDCFQNFISLLFGSPIP